jgi:hypothetical protein
MKNGCSWQQLCATSYQMHSFMGQLRLQQRYGLARVALAWCGDCALRA